MPRSFSERFRRLAFEVLEDRRMLSFGLTTSSNAYTVDTGAGFVFSIARTTANSADVGDLTSATLNGTQLEAPYSYESRYSHYESGLSSSTVVTATTDPNGNWILIACNDASGYGVTQYYAARKGYNNIYMATYAAGPNSPSPGEMRFIMYTNPSVLTSIPAPSNNNGNSGAIESSDVFGHPDGTTTSKYYGEYEAIETQTYGDTGSGIGVFMNIGNRETSSGGPFFKDIDFQSNELYTYTYSGHSQTEAFRPGLKGPYALMFITSTATPAAPDYSWIDSSGLGSYITGYVGASGRGTLSGTASGVPSSLQATVALSSSSDQYWATPNATTGAYTIAGILPGTYTETLYQGELAVGTKTVTITAGQTTSANIVDSFYTPANPIFSIGTWDGTPIGFLNADKITNMHPTDVRMSPWAADSTGFTNFTVGTDPVSAWPMADWHTETGSTQNGVTTYEDTDNRITFTLTAAQAAQAMTLRIGLTRLDQGRPTISVNSGAWSSAVPSIYSEPNSARLNHGQLAREQLPLHVQHLQQRVQSRNQHDRYLLHQWIDRHHLLGVSDLRCDRPCPDQFRVAARNRHGHHRTGKCHRWRGRNRDVHRRCQGYHGGRGHGEHRLVRRQRHGRSQWRLRRARDRRHRHNYRHGDHYRYRGVRLVVDIIQLVHRDHFRHWHHDRQRRRQSGTQRHIRHDSDNGRRYFAAALLGRPERSTTSQQSAGYLVGQRRARSRPAAFTLRRPRP